MYDIEREEQILKILKERKTVGVNALAKLVFCSGATIRRDLTKLEKKGLIIRSFGAVSIIESSSNDETFFLIRDNLNVAEKRKIAQKVSEQIESNMTIFVDGSTTMKAIVPFLNDYKNLLIITNGLAIANEIATKTNHKIYVLGGELVSRANSMLGSSTIEELKRFHADLTLLSCAGASVKFGFSEVNDENAKIKRAMINNSNKTIIAFDSSKINSDKAFKSADMDEVDIICISSELEDKVKKEIKAKAKQVIEY